MGIFDEGESAEVKSIFKYLSDPNNWLTKSHKTYPPLPRSIDDVVSDWAESTGMSVEIVAPTHNRFLSMEKWVEALKEVWDNEEPMIVIRNDDGIQIHEIFGWNESNLGLTGNQKEVDYKWTAIDIQTGSGRIRHPIPGFHDSNREESFVFENFKAFLTTVGSIEMIEVKEDQGGGNWKTVERPNYQSSNPGYLLIQSLMIPQPYNCTLPKVMTNKIRKELEALRP